MNFDELLLPIGLECPKELVGVEVSKIVTDSRKATQNSIFICIEGARYDGHDHITEAVNAGAKVIVAKIVRDVCVGGAALLYVENTRNVSSLLYNRWYNDPTSDIKIIGVTGTNGKTSIAYMIYNILESAGKRVGLIGTVECLSVDRKPLLKGGNMTTPDPEELYSMLAKMKSDGAEYVVMEVSSHALAQGRVEAISFELALFTNLSEEHLDFHSDMEDYFQTKKRLFNKAKKAVVNIDDAYGERIHSLLYEKGSFVKSCSQRRGDFCALDAKIGESGNEYVYLENDDKCHSYTVKTRLSGEFQIMNSLEAIAAARCCEIDIGTAVSAISNIKRILGRMERVEIYPDQDIKIFIDYAHTPDALETLMRSVRGFSKPQGRIILLFGCGGDRDRSKRKTMGQIASRLADLVIVTSDNPRSEDPKQIIKEILKGINKEKEFVAIESRKEAIEQAIIYYARANDTVVLAGKGHETYEIDGSGLHSFDEREIVYKALDVRRKMQRERTEENEG